MSTKTEKPSKASKAAKASPDQLAEAATVIKKSEKSEKIDKQSKAQIAERITKEKKLKYIYPEDIDTLAKRKRFREIARSQNEKLRKRIKLAAKGKLDGVTEAQAQKEFDAFVKKTYPQGTVA